MANLLLFCDGACSGNGKKGASGGWAWAVWVSEAIGATRATGRIHGLPDTWAAGKLATTMGVATNQRAELTALLEALTWIKDYPHLSAIIYSDSKYAINCTSVWGAGWKRKGWTRPTGPLQNLDLIQPLVELWESVKAHVKLEHVAGHQTGSSPTAYGNNWVDRAAVEGAQGIEHDAECLNLDELTEPTSKPLAINHVLTYEPGDIRNWL